MSTFKEILDLSRVTASIKHPASRTLKLLCGNPTHPSEACSADVVEGVDEFDLIQQAEQKGWYFTAEEKIRYFNFASVIKRDYWRGNCPVCRVTNILEESK